MWIEASGGGGGTQITPSDVTPVALVNGETYEMGGNGYAIESYDDVTPTALGAAFLAGMNKMSAGGFAYSEKPKIKIGTFTPSASQFSVTGVGFKPKYLAVYTARTTPTNPGILYIYNEDFSTEKYMYGSGDASVTLRDLGETGNYRLHSIDNDGFTVNGYVTASWRGTGYYFALG